MNYIPLLNFALSLAGAAIGVYVGLRVAVARLQEQIRALNERVGNHYELFDKRITRIEERVFFRGEK
jgi:hypothetical protein